MDTPAAERLRLTEIFLSVQGEARAVGWPTVFVRLTGCPLRCQYCDTAYAFHGGEWWEIETILAEVARHGVRHVCVTGGEPLAQKRCLVLLEKLCDAGYEVSLETSGAIDVAGAELLRRAYIDHDVRFHSVEGIGLCVGHEGQAEGNEKQEDLAAHFVSFARLNRETG